MTFSDLVKPEAVIPDLKSADRDGVIRELVDALVAAGAITADDAPALARGVIEREKKGSTGFGKGVAIPHVKHKSVPRAVAAVGNSQGGIDFRSLDGQPVFSVVLLLSPDNADEHLAAMNVIWPKLNNDRFRKFLRQSRTSQDIIELLGEQGM